MPTTQVNGVGIHYQRAGQGPDVVLVHGLGANMAFWYLAAFPALRRDFRVTAYDLRGHGYSAMPASGYASRDMATDLSGLLGFLATGRAHVVGHSFGAAVALHLAIQHPDSVASLTLADPVIPALVSDSRTGHTLELLAELANVGAVPPSGLTPPVPFGSSGAGPAAQRWQQLLEDTTARAEFGSLTGMTMKEISTVRQPTLVLFGARSRWLATRSALEDVLPDARVMVVPDAGHFHPLVKPRTFVQLLRIFLTGQDVAAGDPPHGI